MESSIRTVCSFSNFFLFFKLHKFCLKVIRLISDYLRFVSNVGICSGGVLRKVDFNF